MFIRTDIHSSFVLAVEGNEISGKYTSVGAAGNISSKLSDLAEPNQILVSETTLVAYRKHFKVNNKQEVYIKNLDRKLIVHPVHGRRNISVGAERLAQLNLPVSSETH